MKQRFGSSGFLLVLFLLIVLGVLAAVFVFFDGFNREDPGLGAFGSDGNDTEILYYNSVPYTPKESLETILFIGLDAEGTVDELDEVHLADFLTLAVIDHDAEQVHFVHLNRDTMAYINQLDHADKTIATAYMQLGRSHIFGSSETVRCHNTVKAVERLLYQINIDYFVMMTMDAVAAVNDAVGGITLPLLADFTHVDPTYTEGSVVTLMGDFALTYIRARGEMEVKTNLARMERQKQYMEQFLYSYLTLLHDGSSAVRKILETDAASYLQTDLTVHQITRLGEKVRGYTFCGMESVAGEAVVGKEYMEFYVDETALQEMVLSLFYREYTE